MDETLLPVLRDESMEAVDAILQGSDAFTVVAPTLAAGARRSPGALCRRQLSTGEQAPTATDQLKKAKQRNKLLFGGIAAGLVASLDTPHGPVPLALKQATVDEATLSREQLEMIRQNMPTPEEMAEITKLDGPDVKWDKPETFESMLELDWTRANEGGRLVRAVGRVDDGGKDTVGEEMEEGKAEEVREGEAVRDRANRCDYRRYGCYSPCTKSNEDTYVSRATKNGTIVSWGKTHS